MSDSARQRRRYRPSPAVVVATRPRTFSDDFDSSGSEAFYSDRGAVTPPLASAAPGPFYVHRSTHELDSLLVPFAFDLEHLSNALDPFPARNSVAWGAQRRKRLVQSRFRPRILASFRELNRLRLDPRTRTCMRRAVRKNVMFARGIAGRRGLGRNGVRRSVSSSWSC